MTILWPQSTAHYWIGCGVWLVVGILVSGIIVRGWPQDEREDPLLVSALVTAVVAFGWPIEQFIVYFVAACVAIGVAIHMAARS